MKGEIVKKNNGKFVIFFGWKYPFPSEGDSDNGIHEVMRMSRDVDPIRLRIGFGSDTSSVQWAKLLGILQKSDPMTGLLLGLQLFV